MRQAPAQHHLGAPPINKYKPLKPTVIALQTCGSLYNVIQKDKNLITPRTTAMARELRNTGYNLLLPDSLTPHVKVLVCTESLQRRDVQSALAGPPGRRRPGPHRAAGLRQ